MLVAHLVVLTGDVSGPQVDEAVSMIGVQVRRPHERHCAAVNVDLTDVVRLDGAFVDHLRSLRREARTLTVVLSLTAPRDSPAHRLLAFHQGLGEALPPVYTDRPPWIGGTST